MVIRRVFICFTLTAGLAGAQATEPTKMAKPVDYPTAGVALAVPTSYSLAALENANQIFRFISTATKHNLAKAFGESITLSVFSAGSGDLARKFFSAQPKAGGKRKLINQKILSTTPLRIAGLDGLARSLSYERAGRKISAVSVCFIRSLEIPASIAFKATGIRKPKTVRLAYVLQMEMPDNKKDSLLPSVDQIVKTITLTDLRRPIEVPLKFSTVGGRFCLPRHGLVIRELVGWFHEVDKQGITITRPDFMLDGALTPIITISTQPVPGGGLTAPTSRPSTQPASKPAKPTPNLAKPAQPVIEVRRFLHRTDVKPSKSQCVVLSVTAQGCDVATARKIMNSLAAGILPRPTTKPAGAKKTTCASQPIPVKSGL